jgi:hypothetical protein
MASIDVASPLQRFDYETAFQRCAELGYTLTQVAALTNKSFPTARAYLKGETDPPSGWLCSLAVLLELDGPGDLFRPIDASDLGTTVAVDAKPRLRTLPRRQRQARVQRGNEPATASPAPRRMQRS